MNSKRRNNSFFIDRSLGRVAVASALKAAGYSNLIVHDEYFPQDTPDETWLKEAGANGWIVLSRDSRIRYRANEKSALTDAGVLAFFMTATNITGEEMGAIFVKAARKMLAIASSEPRPAIYKIGRDGRPVKI